MRRRHSLASAALVLVYLALPLNAHAYIDPATTTYVIQIVSAIVITLGITIGVFFGRIRMFLLNARVKLTSMRIKLMTKKQATPSPLYEQYLAALPSAQQSRKSLLWQDSRSFLQRLALAAGMSLAVSFTFLVFGPFELYALNVDSFTIAFTGVFGSLLLAAAGLFLLMTAFLTVTRGKVFDAMLSLMMGFLLAGYIQGNFLNRSLGQLTGDLIGWHQLGTAFVINTVIWGAILAVPFLLHSLSKTLWTGFVRFLPIIMVVIQLIPMVSLSGLALNQQPSTTRLLSTEGLYEVAKEDNIIVIILDRLDNRYMDELMADDPHFLDKLDGFTRFTNNTTLYSQTFPAVANFLTGREYLWEETAAEFLKDAYQNSSFLPGLRDAGYRINLYTEARASYYYASDLEGIVDNIADARVSYRPLSALKQFLKLSAFRYGPLALKPFVWTSTAQFSQLVDAHMEPGPFSPDNRLFYERLRQEGLSVGQSEKTFSLIHLDGPHAPFIINEYVEPVPENLGTFMGQLKGSFRIVYEYLDQLKALGKYDDATIIIMGDHGERQGDIIPPQQAITGGLLIKPKGSSGTPLASNAAPTSSDNFRATIYKEAGLSTEGLGLTFFQVPPDAKEIRYLHHWLLGEGGGPNRLLIYEIDGNANDFGNWSLIEEKPLRQSATWRSL